MQSWGFGSSWAVTITSFFIAPIMWSYSLVWQLQLLAAVAVCKALGTLLFFFVGHYWCVLAAWLQSCSFLTLAYAGTFQGVYDSTVTAVRCSFCDVCPSVSAVLEARLRAFTHQQQQFEATIHAVLQQGTILHAALEWLEGEYHERACSVVSCVVTLLPQHSLYLQRSSLLFSFLPSPKHWLCCTSHVVAAETWSHSVDAGT